MAACVVTSIDGLQALRDGWDELATSAACPLLDHDWIASCAETLHDGHDLRIVTTFEQGVLTGVAPLVRGTMAGRRHLVLLGSGDLYEPGGWLFSSPAALAELTSAVIQLGSPVLLHRVPTMSSLSAMLPALVRGRALTMTRATAPSLSVETRGSWREFCSRMSSRTLGKLSRSLASAESALGPSRVDELAPRPDEVTGLLETFAAVEDSGWKGRRGSSMAQRADLAAFFGSFCAKAAERGRLRVTRLSFGPQVAAVEIAIDAYRRRWGLKIGFRHELAKHAPGLHLVHASIRAAVERGLDSYEFLGVAESWQQRWKPAARPCQLIAVYPWNMPGLVSAGRDIGAALFRRAHRLWRSGMFGGSR